MRWVVMYALVCTIVCTASIVIAATSGGGSAHTNNWALLVCTSRYWFNYRHIANVLSIYHTVKAMGIPDSNIILMLPDDMACNPRNSFAAQMFNDKSRTINLYSSDVEVDYRGTEVSVETFIRVLTGRHHTHIPRSKRLLTDSGSNVLVYLTGHGGDEFLKFQDSEEISAWDFHDAFNTMYIQHRYNRLLFMVDTCQAATLQNHILSNKLPNVVSIGSSRLAENSYSLSHSDEIGVSVIDRFTYYTLNFFQNRANSHTPPTIQQLFSSYDYNALHSNAQWSSSLSQSLSRVPASDFFGAVSDVIYTGSAPPPLPPATANRTAMGRSRDSQRPRVTTTIATAPTTATSVLATTTNDVSAPARRSRPLRTADGTASAAASSEANAMAFRFACGAGLGLAVISAAFESRRRQKLHTL